MPETRRTCGRIAACRCRELPLRLTSLESSVVWSAVKVALDREGMKGPAPRRLVAMRPVFAIHCVDPVPDQGAATRVHRGEPTHLVLEHVQFQRVSRGRGLIGDAGRRPAQLEFRREPDERRQFPVAVEYGAGADRPRCRQRCSRPAQSGSGCCGPTRSACTRATGGQGWPHVNCTGCPWRSKGM